MEVPTFFPDLVQNRVKSVSFNKRQVVSLLILNEIRGVVFTIYIWLPLLRLLSHKMNPVVAVILQKAMG